MRLDPGISHSPNGGIFRIMVPSGQLGAGVRAAEVERGLALGAQAIALDAGSTDSGAAYLAEGVSKNSREAVKRDLRILMTAQAKADIPLLVGSCGQAGGDLNVDWTVAIVRELIEELGIKPRLAVLRSELQAAELKASNAAGRIRPLAPSPPLADDRLDACAHIVAVMGPEPYIAALDAGADIILGGRTTDTAVIAAFALRHGVKPALAWHAGKIAECGGQCTTNPIGSSGVLLSLGPSSFVVEPLGESVGCSVHSVSAHMLYENSDPFRLTEPGGVLDVTDARYVRLDDRRVEVSGALWEPTAYTVKLEGASAGAYQTVMLVGIQDPEVLGQLEAFERRLSAALYERVRSTIGSEAGAFDISLRLYGWNAVSGEPVPEVTPPPREVGVLCVVTAATQSLATRIAKTCNPYLFHYPIRPGIELPSYAFPFSPADIERGRIFQFELNHVLELDDPLQVVRIDQLAASSFEENVR